VTAQLSAPVRIVALVGLLAAMGVAMWTLVLSRNGESAASSASPASPETAAVVKDPVAAAKAVAGKLDAHNRATAAEKSDTVKPDTAAPTRAAAPSVRAVKPAKAAAPAPARPAHHAAATPRTKHATSIATLLRHHRVVVVLLYDPQSKIDSYSVGETELGAANAHAGFLRVNVLNRRQSEVFAKTYQSLQTPTVLFFTRGGKLVQKLTGFADHESVAQAATNAAHGLVAAG